MKNKPVLIQSSIIRRNLSKEESEHYINSFPYKQRKDMYTDKWFNTIQDIYI